MNFISEMKQRKESLLKNSEQYKNSELKLSLEKKVIIIELLFFRIKKCIKIKQFILISLSLNHQSKKKKVAD